jgi:hypothetical protein
VGDIARPGGDHSQKRPQIFQQKSAARRGLQPSPKPLVWMQADGWTDKYAAAKIKEVGS